MVTEMTQQEIEVLMARLSAEIAEIKQYIKSVRDQLDGHKND